MQDTWGENYCRFVPPGNGGLYMPDNPAYRAADIDGDGLICGLGFTAGLTATVAAPDDREVVGAYGPAEQRRR